MLTIEEAERIRKEHNLSLEQFSLKLGYTSSAYAQAIRRGKLARFMVREIALRFKVPMHGKR